MLQIVLPLDHYKIWFLANEICEEFCNNSKIKFHYLCQIL